MNRFATLLFSLFLTLPFWSLTQSWDDDNYTSYRVRLYENVAENNGLFSNEKNEGLVPFLQNNCGQNTQFKGIPFEQKGVSPAELSLKKSALLKVKCTETVQKDLYGDIRLNAKGETISIKSCDSIYYLFPKENVEWQVKEKLVSLKDDWELDQISLYYYFKSGNQMIKTLVFSMEREDYLTLLKSKNTSDYFASSTLKSQVVCKEIDRFNNLNPFGFTTIKQACNSIRFELLEKGQLGFVKKAASDQSLVLFLGGNLKNNVNLLYTESGDLNFEAAYLATSTQLKDEVKLKEGLGFYWVPEGESYADYTATIAIKETRGGGGDFTRKMVYHPAKLADLVEIRLKKELIWDATSNSYQFQTVAFCPVFEHNFEETTLQSNLVWYSLEKSESQLNGDKPYWLNLLESKVIMGLVFGEYNCAK